MRALEFLKDLWPHIAAVLTIAVSVLASGHAILNKRNVRSSIAWVSLVWLAPVVGAVFYLLLGINRIRRRAVSPGLGIDAIGNHARRRHVPLDIREQPGLA